MAAPRTVRIVLHRGNEAEPLLSVKAPVTPAIRRGLRRIERIGDVDLVGSEGRLVRLKGISLRPEVLSDVGIEVEYEPEEG